MEDFYTCHHRGQEYIAVLAYYDRNDTLIEITSIDRRVVLRTLSNIQSELIQIVQDAANVQFRVIP